MKPGLPMLIAMSAIGPIALNIFIPSMPGLAIALGTDYQTAQLTLTFFLVSLAISQLFVGPVSDRLGRRPVFLAGMCLFIASSILCAMAGSITQLIIGRLFQAAGGCTGIVLARAIIRDLYDRDESASLLGYLTMAMVVAPMIAPTIGGVLDGWAGWRAGFYVTAILGALVFAVALYKLHETNLDPDTSSSQVDFFRKSAQLLRMPVFLGYALNSAFGSGIFFAFIAGAPFVVTDVMGGTPRDYGLYFIIVSIGYMFGNFLSGRYARRAGANRMMVIGSTVSVLGIALLITGAFAGLITPFWLFGSMSVVAISNGLTIPSATAGAISVRPDIPGTGAGLSGFFQIGVGALSTFMVGFFHDGTHWPMVGIMAASGTIAIGFLLLALSSSKGS
ncbi:MAG: multidrug effflux MFS transporter [Hyphomicrobiales bacterium]